MDNSQPPTSPWLSFPRVLWVALAASLALALLALRSSFMPDDFIFLGIAGEVPPPAPLANSSLDLYRITSGDPAQLRPLMQKGVFPWWVMPDLRVAFWRPLSSALFMLDHSLFGTQPMGYLAHSALWYVGLVALAGALLWRVLPGAVGAMALMLFAIDDSHASTVGWVANRSAMISMLFALMAVCLHLEWRVRRRTWALPLSVLALLVGLAAGETALMVCAYLFAYELVGAEGRLSERLRALAPTGLVLLVYSVVRYRLGYGATGSDMYIDPLAHPLHWLKTALLWVPVNLGGVLLNAPPDMVNEARFELPLAGVGIAGLVLVGLMLRASWSGLSETERRQVRWLMVGFFVSVVASATTVPSTRSILVPSLGASILIAVVVHHAWRRRERNWGGRAMVAGAGLLVLLHVLLAPYGWWSTMDLFHNVAASNERIQKQYVDILDARRLPQQRVVMINVPNPIVGIYASVQWWSTGKELPAAWWVLSYAPHEHRVTRTGPSTLEMELEGGRFFATVGERIHRSSLYPLPAGHEVKLDGMVVKVLEADAEGPRKLSFTFDVPLEDPSLVLLHWKNRRVRHFEIPPMGEPVSLNAMKLE